MTQTDQIRADLLAGVELTPLDALNKYGCFRLAARVAELRREGLSVETVVDKGSGKKYARYRIATPVQVALDL